MLQYIERKKWITVNSIIGVIVTEAYLLGTDNTLVPQIVKLKIT